MLDLSFIKKLFPFKKSSIGSATELLKQLESTCGVGFNVGTGAIPPVAGLLMVDPNESLLPLFVKAVAKQDDTVIVLDKEGTLAKYTFNPADDFIIDSRNANGVNWIPFWEIKSKWDIPSVVKTYLNKKKHTVKAVQQASDDLLSKICEHLLDAQELNYRNLVTLLFYPSASELAAILGEDPDSDYLLQLGVVRDHLKDLNNPALYDSSGFQFSVKDMLDAEHSGKLFLVYDDDPEQIAQYRCLLDIAFQHLINSGDSDTRRVWFITNSVSEFEHVTNLRAMLAKQIQKHVCIAVGIKSSTDGCAALDLVKGSTPCLLVKPSLTDLSDLVQLANGKVNVGPMLEALKSKLLPDNYLIQFGNKVFKATHRVLKESSYSFLPKPLVEFVPNPKFLTPAEVTRSSATRTPPANPELAVPVLDRLTELKAHKPHKEEGGTASRGESSSNVRITPARHDLAPSPNDAISQKPSGAGVLPRRRENPAPSKPSQPRYVDPITAAAGPKKEDKPPKTALPVYKDPVLKTAREQDIKVEDVSAASKYELPSSRFLSKKKQTEGFNARDLSGILSKPKELETGSVVEENPENPSEAV